MNKSLIITTFIGILAILGLFFLPRVVMKKEGSGKPKMGVAVRDTTRLKEEGHDDHEGHEAEQHAQKLTPIQQSQINKLQSLFIASNESSKINAGLKLAEKYAEFQLFDSAGFTIEKVEKLAPTEANSTLAGNYFYQAFTYAVSDDKTNLMGEKTRAFYEKALIKNPNNLLAKTNMAMTYVSTQTPMQGILMLREVVAANPDYEPAVFNLGLLSVRSNQFAKAAERFKQVLKNNPKNTKAAFYLGLSLVRLGRNTEAKEILLQVKQKDNDAAVQAEVQSLLNELN